MAYKFSLHIHITDKGECEVTGPLNDPRLCMLIISDAIRVIANPKVKDEPRIVVPSMTGMRPRIPGNGG
jgi:hypothetical protein